ncbi:hypothetical protein [Streptomyces sp. G-G2]|uniref:hypothetical protein n=1 Tax=Streptomyces sp. G-G2 TaxID=3046201 RepID=UPI0024B96018|nr:hypothetical protein [Streptomyces sp. G-G2]MDJ0384881.1 hypothetical protein [Streptomyces sp. G-G2]
MHRTAAELADGRELSYYDSAPGRDHEAKDQRPLDRAGGVRELRRDPATGDWVAIAAHRQSRTHHRPTGACPLRPSRGGLRSEIPDAVHEVAVYENHFLSGAVGRSTDRVPRAPSRRVTWRAPVGLGVGTTAPLWPWPSRRGRC